VVRVKTFEELKQRLLYAQAIETARCLETGVLETPQDADLGSIYGWGFPAWTGGTQQMLDRGGRVSRFQKKFSGFLKKD